jgi:hypothetical protein
VKAKILIRAGARIFRSDEDADVVKTPMEATVAQVLEDGYDTVYEFVYQKDGKWGRWTVGSEDVTIL